MRRAASTLAVLALLACPAAPSPAPDASVEVAPADLAGDTELAEVSGKSIYSLKLVTKEGQTYEITDRDLTTSPTAYAFGSTHIAPAVGLAVSDTVSFPAFIAVTFNFGIIVGSPEHPVDCDAPGTYDFGTGSPPELRVTVQGLEYGSAVSAAAGTLFVELWTATTGGPMKGTVKGTLLQVDSPEGQAPRPLDVDGQFSFTLPEKAQGG